VPATWGMTIEREDFFDFLGGGALSSRLVPIVSALGRPFDTGIEIASPRAGGANDTAAQDASATMHSITCRDGSFKFASLLLPTDSKYSSRLVDYNRSACIPTVPRICSVLTIASVHETPGKLGAESMREYIKKLLFADECI
jgi:hypothetical protein